MQMSIQKYMLFKKIDGFDWDDGNWPKCGKHGVSKTEIEEVILNGPAVMPDPCRTEIRMRAIGKTQAGRHVFLVYQIREVLGLRLLRPISARFMHKKEIESYEKQTQTNAIARK